MSPKNPYIARKQATKFTEDIKEAINQPQDSPLLFYAYGIGGIGKSTLINKLIETFSPQFQCAKVSFGINSLINSPLDLMKAFNNRVKGDVSGWDIDPFGELLDKYEQTVQRLASESIEGDANENKPNKGEILKKLGTVVKVGATIGSIFTSGGTATAAANAGGSLLQAGIDKGVDSLVEGATASIDIVDLVKKHRATKDDVELQELITNPLPKLAQAFVQTLIQKSQQQPILLFVDTYEKAASEFDTFFCRFLLSNRNLKQAAVRIVMVGRYSLSNSRYQRMFQQSEISKSERQLDKFNREETKAYLNEIGITKPGDINKFWKATKGYPYYLNLIREQKENGKEIRLSRGGKDMVDLLLDGFSDAEKKVIRLAAYCRWFDHSIIEYLIEQNNIEENSEHSWYDWLVNRDFTVEESHYRFDDVARDIIRQAEHNYDKRNFAQIHQQLSNYFQQLADETIDPDELVDDKYEDPDWCEYTVEATYHALYADKKQGQLKLLTHFFEGAYLRFPNVAEKPFAGVMSEMGMEDLTLLPGNTKQFLLDISWAIVFGWQFIGQNPNFYNIKADYVESNCESDISDFVKFQMELSISKCIKRKNDLTGLAKCIAFFGEYIKSDNLELQLKSLRQSEEELEKLRIEEYQELMATILMRLISLLFDKKEYAQVLEKCDRVIRISPREFLAWKNKAITLGEIGQYNEALICFNKAVELNPEDYSIRAERGVVLGNMGQEQQALDDFNAALKINPDHSWVWRNRALALLNLKNPHLALIDCNKALKINSTDSKAYRNRGIILYAMNKYSEAIESLDKAIKLDSSDFLSWSDRGQIFYRLQKYNEALYNYNKAISLTPDNPEFLNMKALVLSLKGKYDEALSNIGRVIELEPHEILYTANKSIILSRMNSFDKALIYAEEVIKSKPEDESGYYAKACYFALQNNEQEAIANLKKAIAISPFKCKLEAKHNPDFDCLKDNPEFQALIN